MVVRSHAFATRMGGLRPLKGRSGYAGQGGLRPPIAAYGRLGMALRAMPPARRAVSRPQGLCPVGATLSVLLGFAVYR